MGTEEADDTDKTLMAGNIKQAYIDSSLRYYHDVIQQPELNHIANSDSTGAIHHEEAWAEHLPGGCASLFG